MDDMQAVDADAALLRQAISNLLDNALKFTPANGRVTVRAEQRNGDQLITVADTGVGIAPTDQARLFEKFYRAGSAEVLHEQGLGLGLAIVKSIVEQHHGRIQVESRLGQGSTFTIIIPRKSPGTNP
jgi:signal transduction histidine kinase